MLNGIKMMPMDLNWDDVQIVPDSIKEYTEEEMKNRGNE